MAFSWFENWDPEERQKRKTKITASAFGNTLNPGTTGEMVPVSSAKELDTGHKITPSLPLVPAPYVKQSTCLTHGTGALAVSAPREGSTSQKPYLLNKCRGHCRPPGHRYHHLLWRIPGKPGCHRWTNLSTTFSFGFLLSKPLHWIYNHSWRQGGLNQKIFYFPVPKC